MIDEQPLIDQLLKQARIPDLAIDIEITLVDPPEYLAILHEYVARRIFIRTN
jgi:hypothetical protein